MLKSNNIEVKIIKDIDVSDKLWCNEAVLISVKNGKGSLIHISSDENEDYNCISHLIINNTPIVQGKYPICPTCAGLLATGYGIENADCAELKEIRDKINDDYIDIKSSVENIKSLLGLLKDGMYVIADIPHYPTDGSNHFFYNIPNDLTINRATTMSYYIHELLTVTDGFPAYLYPTQSASCLNQQRIEYYIEKIKNNKNAPRAIAYYEQGFVSALIDGHHKACAAAKLKKQVNCITIMPIDGYQYDGPYKNNKTMIKSLFFSTIEINLEKEQPLCDFSDKLSRKKMPLKVYSSTLNYGQFKEYDSLITDVYPTIDELAKIYALEINYKTVSDNEIMEWINNPTKESSFCLENMLNYYIRTNKEKARKLGLTIIRKNHENTPISTAYRILKHFKDEETEKIFIDYLINHDDRSEFYNIVNSYWD